MGAYLSTFAPCIPTYLYGDAAGRRVTRPRPSTSEVKAIFTHTVPGRRLPGRRAAGDDVPARAADGRDRLRYRLRQARVAASQLHPDATAFPYQTPVALQYDSGDYFTTLRRCARIRPTGTASRHGGTEAAAAQGQAARHRHLDLCRSLRHCAQSLGRGLARGAGRALRMWRTSACIPTGSVTVFTGSHSHGQGHETTFAQLVSRPARRANGARSTSCMAIPRKIPFGMGTYGSRSLAVGGSAMVKAMDKIIAKGKRIAAHLMEAAVEDIEFKDGRFSVAGTDKSKALSEVSLAAYVPHNYPIDETRARPRRDRLLRSRRTSPIPAAATSARSRSTRETGTVRRDQLYRRSTTSAGSSIR